MAYENSVITALRGATPGAAAGAASPGVSFFNPYANSAMPQASSMAMPNVINALRTNNTSMPGAAAPGAMTPDAMTATAMPMSNAMPNAQGQSVAPSRQPVGQYEERRTTSFGTPGAQNNLVQYLMNRGDRQTLSNLASQGNWKVEDARNAIDPSRFGELDAAFATAPSRNAASIQMPDYAQQFMQLSNMGRIQDTGTQNLFNQYLSEGSRGGMEDAKGVITPASSGDAFLSLNAPAAMQDYAPTQQYNYQTRRYETVAAPKQLTNADIFRRAVERAGPAPLYTNGNMSSTVPFSELNDRMGYFSGMSPLSY